MTVSNIVLNYAKISILQLPELNSSPSTEAPLCNLKWRRGRLWVSRDHLSQAVPLPALRGDRWLEDCISHTHADDIYLDLDLGEAALQRWTSLCQASEKRAFVRLPSLRTRTHIRNTFCWKLKRSADVLAAGLLLLVLSPLFVAIALIVRLTSPGPVLYKQWRVGERGKLFQMIKFRSMVPNAEALHHAVMGEQSGLHKLKDDPRITSVGRWLRKYSLDELPQLLNVLRGEMSLVGPRPWALYDAVRISSEQRYRLNALPGITGAWQVQGRAYLLDLEAANRCDIEYLTTWSLLGDLKFLLLTVPKVLSGFGAY